jgi:hypothetical protein
MSEQSPDKSFRVVAFNDDGTIGCIHAHLTKVVAEGMKNMLTVTFPRVLIEDDRLPAR